MVVFRFIVVMNMRMDVIMIVNPMKMIMRVSVIHLSVMVIMRMSVVMAVAMPVIMTMIVSSLAQYNRGHHVDHQPGGNGIGGIDTKVIHRSYRLITELS